MLFSDNDAETLFFYARLPMITLGLVLGVFIYLWAKELFGLHAAVAVLFIYGLDPDILAHSPVVHTDIPFTTFLFIGTYFFWRLLDKLSWSNLLATCLFFGLAVTTKYNFFTILPIWGILGLLKILSTESPTGISPWGPLSRRGSKASVLAGVLICAAITACLFIWAAYGFRFEAFREGIDRHLLMAWVMPDGALLQRLVAFSSQHQLFPEAWIYGFLYVGRFLNRPAYLLGQISDDGFWLYFPVAFAVKTPVPILILLLAGVGMWVFKRRDRYHEFYLLIPVVVYFALAVYSRLNLGLRHLLPIYPFLFILIGGTVTEIWWSGTYRKRVVLIFLGLWYLWSSVYSFPYYLAFFNEMAGGAKNGY